MVSVFSTGSKAFLWWRSLLKKWMGNDTASSMCLSARNVVLIFTHTHKKGWWQARRIVQPKLHGQGDFRCKTTHPGEMSWPGWAHDSAILCMCAQTHKRYILLSCTQLSRVVRSFGLQCLDFYRSKKERRNSYPIKKFKAILTACGLCVIKWVSGQYGSADLG